MAAQFDVSSLNSDEFLSDKNITAVAIAAPAELHYRLVRDALDAGKHVFVEKPLALELAQAEELSEKADSAGLTLMVSHLLQYNPAFLKLLNMVRQGQLVRLQYLYSVPIRL